MNKKKKNESDNIHDVNWSFQDQTVKLKIHEHFFLVLFELITKDINEHPQNRHFILGNIMFFYCQRLKGLLHS